jgi:hypothetical protein
VAWFDFGRQVLPEIEFLWEWSQTGAVGGFKLAAGLFGKVRKTSHICNLEVVQSFHCLPIILPQLFYQTVIPLSRGIYHELK